MKITNYRQTVTESANNCSRSELNELLGLLHASSSKYPMVSQLLMKQNYWQLLHSIRLAWRLITGRGKTYCQLASKTARIEFAI